MAANERDTRRVKALLNRGRPRAALWVAMRPSPFELAQIIGGSICIFIAWWL